MERLCVIFGGASCEHDISIITGMQLCKNLESKYKLEKIYLGLDNNFYLATGIEDISFFVDKSKIKLKQIILHNGAIYFKNMFFKKYCDIAVIINCCHGGVGENGDLHSFFAMNKIRSTDAGSLPSHIAMDKNLTKTLLKDIVPTIKGIKINRDNYEEAIKDVNENFSKYLIAKPNSLGSSIGVKTVDKSNFVEQVDAILLMDESVLIEERIVNKIEYNQACILDNGELILSAIEQPISKDEFLSFDEKYINLNKSKGGDRIIPAKISKTLKNKIDSYTKMIYRALNMRGIVRIDYIFDEDKKVLYFNEINTIPGSMAFYLFEPVGIDYITLIEKLIANVIDDKKYLYFNSDVLSKKCINLILLH